MGELTANQLAGRDTTSCTLTNWVKLCYTNPGWRERLVSEVDAKLQGRAMAWDDVQALSHCNAAFNEVIRMYPPVGIDFRMVRVAATRAPQRSRTGRFQTCVHL